MNKNDRFMLVVVIMLVGSSGCATSYRTPGAGINISSLSTQSDIAELMKREPAAVFPARIAVSRAQASGYYSAGNTCYGKGSFCLVTARDVESEEDLLKIAAMPMVIGVAPVGRLLVPQQLDSIKALRLAAARLKTDVLLVYSLDTRFNVETSEVGPLQLISLGFLPNKKARVTSTASAALFDVRTGFVYGVAESTASEDQRASVWSSRDAVERVRLKTEAQSFHDMISEVEVLWREVVAAHTG